MALIFLVLLLITEGLLRYKFSDTAYVPGPTAIAAQSYMKQHPKVGYLWKDGIDYDDNIILTWSDQDVRPFSTDDIGFINHPRAIEAKANNEKINIIGLGDSNMHLTAFPLHDFFSDQGLRYYNMAMPSHSPPQYNIIFKDYAVHLKPDWVIYGISENDFSDLARFKAWKESGQDWLSWHSGSFFGPPRSPSRVTRFMKKYLRGIYAQYRFTRLTVRRLVLQGMKQHDSIMIMGAKADSERVERILQFIMDAYALASENGIRFIVVLIPSKGTSIERGTFKSYLYDSLSELLAKENIPTIDLREVYSEVEDRATLYYEKDSHWNKYGILLSGEAILEHIRNNNSS